MTSLPTSSATSEAAILKSVPVNAPRPTREWLAGRAVTLLSHFYQVDLADKVAKEAINDWVETLRDLPERAIQLAIWERLKSAERSRPLPGEVRRIARKYINYPLPPANANEPFGPSREFEVVTPERAAEIAAEVSGQIAGVFRKPSTLAAENIINHVLDVFSVRRNEFKSTSRKPEYCRARFAVAYLMREHTSFSLSQIADETFAKDHTTTAYQIAKAEGLLDSDDDFAAQIIEVERRLSA